MASGHRYTRLDSLRGLAALSVGVGHAFLCVYFSQDTSLQAAATGVFNGDYAVDLFFVLSGFVLVDMVRGFSGMHYAAYLGRRLVRLYPLLWGCLLLAYVVQVLVVAHAPACGALSHWICRLIRPPTSIVGAVRSAIPLDYELDPVIWTIRVEIAMSIVYPLALAIWMRGGTAGRIAAAGCSALIFAFSHRMVPQHFLLLFVAGIALNSVRISRARQASFAVAVALVLMAIAGFVVKEHVRAADLAAGASAALLIASVARKCPGWLAVILDNRAILKLGQLSYSYYLLNPIVLWLIAHAGATVFSTLLVGGDDGRAFLVAALLAISAALATVLVATAANRLIEVPSIALSRTVERKILARLGNRSPEPAVQPSQESHFV